MWELSSPGEAAMAVDQALMMLTDLSLSRASPLPHQFCGTFDTFKCRAYQGRLGTLRNSCVS